MFNFIFCFNLLVRSCFKVHSGGPFRKAIHMWLWSRARVSSKWSSRIYLEWNVCIEITYAWCGEYSTCWLCFPCLFYCCKTTSKLYDYYCDSASAGSVMSSAVQIVACSFLSSIGSSCDNFGSTLGWVPSPNINLVLNAQVSFCIQFEICFKIICWHTDVWVTYWLPTFWTIPGKNWACQSFICRKSGTSP